MLAALSKNGVDIAAVFAAVIEHVAAEVVVEAMHAFFGLRGAFVGRESFLVSTRVHLVEVVVASAGVQLLPVESLLAFDEVVPFLWYVVASRGCAEEVGGDDVEHLNVGEAV